MICFLSKQLCPEFLHHVVRDPADVFERETQPIVLNVFGGRGRGDHRHCEVDRGVDVLKAAPVVGNEHLYGSERVRGDVLECLSSGTDRGDPYFERLSIPLRGVDWKHRLLELIEPVRAIKQALGALAGFTSNTFYRLAEAQRVVAQLDLYNRALWPAEDGRFDASTDHGGSFGSGFGGSVDQPDAPSLAIERSRLRRG
ncbi:hypothetical protein BN13_1570021 [Nostocoides jenkinsii Ben 74]|uniref:Uncharacterized protein n=1 Tax=Nostocoides jenkinsii Ben 74 TaxID=1193518 RepID=A0A077M4V1_9MICO|nr:hypothetical protein BN13_1570021 [Tetrasphaera jenkinsii Ben 74]